MAGSGLKEIHAHGKSAEAGQDSPKPYEPHGVCHASGEEKCVGESPVPPEVTVTDAESESITSRSGTTGQNAPMTQTRFGSSGG